MRLPVLALLAAGSAASASAQTYVWDMFITPENGGADSRVSWNFSGTLAWTLSGFPAQGVNLSATMAFGGDVDGLKPFTDSPSPAEYTVGRTGITIINSRTSQTAEVDGFFFPSGNPFMLLSIGFGPTAEGTLPVQNGDVLTWTVPATGSFVIDVPYTTFNQGFWTRNGQTESSIHNLTIGGTPVPEPSTYGLILGGLALAGAALRRRQRAK